jgi:hypothetical protein
LEVHIRQKEYVVKETHQYVFISLQFQLLVYRRAVIYIAITLAAVGGALFIFYHDQIVHAIQPAANWMHKYFTFSLVISRHSLFFQLQVWMDNSYSCFLCDIVPSGMHINPSYHITLTYFPSALRPRDTGYRVWSCMGRVGWFRHSSSWHFHR